MTSEEAAAALATARHLLVILDCDGTLTPIADHPSLARPNRATLAVVERLAAAPDTFVAVVSGRPRSELEDLFPISGVDLVGGHGAEWEGDEELDGEQRELLGKVRSDLEAIAAGHPGTLVEIKPTSIAIHYRQAIDAEEKVVEQVMRGPAQRPRVRVMAGKKVIELSVSRWDKGDAVRRLREKYDADLVCYVGDDVTDEDAFAALLANDVGVKVGPGDTQASMRLESQTDVVPFLESLAVARELHIF
ncbi:MAG TPA: trehalose-phosphatase [Acidimicrobiia bacterium]